MPVEFTEEEKLGMFPALESVERINMLVYLNNKGPQTHSGVKEEFSIGDERYIHHFNKLHGVGLVDYDRSRQTTDEIYGRVVITEKGKRALAELVFH